MDDILKLLLRHAVLAMVVGVCATLLYKLFREYYIKIREWLK